MSDSATDSAASIDHLTHLRHDVERIADIVEGGPLEAPVAACPGWALADLVIHLGNVHRWANAAITTAAQPTVKPEPPAREGAALAGWLRDGLAQLAASLASIDPTAPTWHPFPAPKVGGLWPRRQAQEAFVHRFDAEQAVGEVTSMDPLLAADGIDEYFGVMLPRVVTRENLTLPSTSLHVHCTDTHGEWIVRSVDNTVELERIHAKGDAALRGPAAALLLRLWSRPVGAGEIETIGSTDAADAWLALGGA